MDEPSQSIEKDPTENILQVSKNCIESHQTTQVEEAFGATFFFPGAVHAVPFVSFPLGAMGCEDANRHGANMLWSCLKGP